MFLTIEGCEGAGKSTLIESLCRRLEEGGRTVLITREPGGTPLGDQIRALLLSRSCPISARAELMLFLTSRVQHIEEVIKPALASGKVVLCDRFHDSTIAYQGAGRGLGLQEVEALCMSCCMGFQADMTLLLDLDPEMGLRRITRERDSLEREPLDFHKRVREAFLRLAERHVGRIRLLNASCDKEVLLDQALFAVEQALTQSHKR